MFHPALMHEVARLQQARTPFCVVTVVDGRGSLPQPVGAKALYTADGLRFGTVGGGVIEARCGEHAAALLAGGRAQTPRLLSWNLQRDLGMTCGGEARLFFEVYRPEGEWRVALFGAGHVAQKLARFLVEFDCRVTCFDTRADWLARLPESPQLERRPVVAYADGVAEVPAHAAVVVMTMGHATDLPVLEALAAHATPPAFVGLIGSASKARRARRELREGGAPEAFVERLACPVGDPTGDPSPAGIALAVVNQLLRLRHATAAESAESS